MMKREIRSKFSLIATHSLEVPNRRDMPSIKIEDILLYFGIPIQEAKCRSCKKDYLNFIFPFLNLGALKPGRLG